MKKSKLKEIKRRASRNCWPRAANSAQEMFNLRLQQASAQLEKPARLRTLRRDIARIETRISALAQESRLTISELWLTTPTTITAARGQAQRARRRGHLQQDDQDHRGAGRTPFPHPRFKKVVTGYQKFYAHDEKTEAKVGDRVRIEETRPLSKLKRWRLVEVVEKAVQSTPVAA